MRAFAITLGQLFEHSRWLADVEITAVAASTSATGDVQVAQLQLLAGHLHTVVGRQGLELRTTYGLCCAILLPALSATSQALALLLN
jgi:hypothetical protein